MTPSGKRTGRTTSEWQRFDKPAQSSMHEPPKTRSSIFRSGRLFAAGSRMLSYYFWLAGVSGLLGALCYFEHDNVARFTCSLPAECGACSDTVMLCDKQPCWRHAFNLTWQTEASTPDGLYQGVFQEAVLDQACNTLVREADSPVTLLTSITTLRAKNSAVPSEACISWNCQVLRRAFSNCLSARGLNSSSAANDCPCNDMAMSAEEAQSVQSLCGFMPNELAAVRARVAEVNTVNVSQLRPAQFTTRPIVGSLQSLPNVSGVSGRICQGKDCGSERRLQTVQEWSVSEWSECTCYLQCTAGVRTRSVSCPPGVSCAEQKPSDAKPCTCEHCSNCSVQPYVFGMGISYSINGGTAFWLWLAFLALSTCDEDDFVGMSWSLKFLGCFCKCVPPVTKVMAVVTLFFTSVITLTTLTPLELRPGDRYSDCRGSSSMKQMAYGGAAAWLFIFTVGIYVHKRKPKPPWLHAELSGALGLLWKPFSIFGP